MSDDPWEECDFSGLAKITCSHCQGHTLGDEKEGPATLTEDDYERVGRRFEARYPGRCTIDMDHRVKVGDLVSRVQHPSNPMIAVPGVACSMCTKSLPVADE